MRVDERPSDEMSKADSDRVRASMRRPTSFGPCPSGVGRAVGSAAAPAIGEQARISRVLWAFLMTTLLSGVAACRRDPGPELPESVVREFIERMRRVHGDSESQRAAYELLWSEARENLAERAERATALVGRKSAPEEMITPSRFTWKFEPKTFASTTSGNWATVTITGDETETDVAQVPVVREDGQWRVAIRFPPLSPIRKRVREDHETD